MVLLFLVALFATAYWFDRAPEIVQTPEQLTITYWEKWTGFEGAAMKGTVDLFNKKKIKNAKGQVIFCKYLTTTQVDRKSLLAIAGGTPPDLCGFWERNNHVYADMGALMPLDEFIKRDNGTGGFDTENYIPIFLDSCRHRGQTWSLPTTPATIALHWNKDMFRRAGLDPDRPPRNTQELEEYNQKLTIKDANGRMVQMGFLPPEPGWWHYAWPYFFGGKLTVGLDKITANDPKNIEAFEWLMKFKQGYDPAMLLSFKQSFGNAFDSPQNAFMSNKVAMVIQGVWMANFIRFHNPQMDWGCGPFPTSFDTKGEPVTIVDLDIITIPRGCRNPEEAWQVIKFINTHEGMEFLCGGKENNGGQGKLTPFKTNTPGWIEAHTHKQLKVFIDLARSKNAVAIPQVPIWEQYQEEMKDAFEGAWLNKKTPAQALQAVQDRMQPELDRCNQIYNARMQALKKD